MLFVCKALEWVHCPGGGKRTRRMEALYIVALCVPLAVFFNFFSLDPDLSLAQPFSSFHPFYPKHNCVIIRYALSRSLSVQYLWITCRHPPILLRIVATSLSFPFPLPGKAGHWTTESVCLKLQNKQTKKTKKIRKVEWRRNWVTFTHWSTKQQ